MFELKQWIKNTPLEKKFTNIISIYFLLEKALSFLQNVFLPVRMDQNVSINLPLSSTLDWKHYEKSLSSTTYTYIHIIKTKYRCHSLKFICST